MNLCYVTAMNDFGLGFLTYYSLRSTVYLALYVLLAPVLIAIVWLFYRPVVLTPIKRGRTPDSHTLGRCDPAPSVIAAVPVSDVIILEKVGDRKLWAKEEHDVMTLE